MRSPGAEATGGMDGSETNGGGRRAPAPKLPPLPTGSTECGGSDTPRRDADKGTWVASQVLTEARDRDAVPDHRDVPWSPENVLIDIVARLQRDLNDTRAES